MRQSDISRRAFLGYGAKAAFAATVPFALSACGSSGSSSKAASTVAAKPDGDLTWFTYEDYVSPKLIASFEKTYGVKVNQVYYTNVEGMVQKVAAGIDYDLITTNSAYNAQLISAGVLKGFDPDKLRNFDQIIPYFRNAPYDRGSVRYTTPYGYGPAGIAYVKGKVNVTNSWNDLWNNPSASGKIYVLDQQDETLGMSLIRDGQSPNSGDNGAVSKAIHNLLSLKPHLGGISSDILSIIDGGEGVMTHAWAGSVYQALTKLKGADNWSFEWPKEGLSMGCDTLSVGAKAKHPGSALLLMQYLLVPEHSFVNTSYTGYSNGTKQGEAAYRHLTRDYPFLALPDANLQTAKWRQAPTGARLSLWNNQWSRFTA